MTFLTQPIDQPPVGNMDADGKTYAVSVRITFDGIEHVGRLWFAEEAWDDRGLADRGALPGRTRDQVLVLARSLSMEELRKRFHRAVAEKRRYISLREATDEIMAKIRYLNQVAISMRAGLLDEEGGTHEIALTEQQLHDCVSNLREHIGVESED